MNERYRAIRAVLWTMTPNRAIDYIKKFNLPYEEELFLIETDVKKKSHVQLMDEYSVSDDVIKSRKRNAYMKIQDAMEHGYD